MADTIALAKSGGVFEVPVRIDDTITLNFIIDSGAGDVSLPLDVVITLYRAGAIKDEDFRGSQTVVLADGSRIPSGRFVLRQLAVGGVTVENVEGDVTTPGNEPSKSPLLGESFLTRLPAWGIDNQRHLLPTGDSSSKPILVGEQSPTETSKPATRKHRRVQPAEPLPEPPIPQQAAISVPPTASKPAKPEVSPVSSDYRPDREARAWLKKAIETTDASDWPEVARMSSAAIAHDRNFADAYIERSIAREELAVAPKPNGNYYCKQSRCRS